MCHHMTTTFLCGHRVIAPIESMCADKICRRNGIFSYFKSGKADTVCHVCHRNYETQLKELRDRPVADWLKEIWEAGAPGSGP